MKNIKKFFSQNPDFNLQTDNLARISVQEKLNWDSFDSKELLPQLQTYQRLYRLHSEPKVVETLMDTGFHSAHQIANLSIEGFTAQLNEKSKGKIDVPTIKTIWNNSRQTAYQVNQMVMALKPERNGTAISKGHNSSTTTTSEEPMKRVAGATNLETDLPSYNQLFGPQYYSECDECKSIWGPAAYFADLMSLIDEYITAPSTNIPAELFLNHRRQDLWNIKLNCENTNTEVPYIQLVNEVLKIKLGNYFTEDINLHLAKNIYPFNIPLNSPEEEIRAFLDHFGFSQAQVLEYLEATDHNIARAALYLSTNQLDLITTDNSTELGDLATAYGLYSSEVGTNNEDVINFITTINNFLDKTDLDINGLTALLFQNCPTPLENEDLSSYAQLYHQFFINQSESNDDNYLGFFNAGIDDENPQEVPIKIVVKNSNGNHTTPSINTLDRLQRFIRLAKKMDWAYADLDWALKSLNHNNITPDAISDLAKVKFVMKQFSIPVDEATALFSDIKTYGQGNGSVSQALFDKIFNQPTYFNNGDSIYHPLYDGNPLFDDSSILAWNPKAALSGNSSDDSKIRSSLLAALHITEVDLAVLLDYFENKNLWIAPTTTQVGTPVSGKVYLTVENLSLLYRYSRLPQLLNVSISQFISLLPDLPTSSFDNIDDLSKVIEHMEEAKASLLSFGQLHYFLHPETPLPLPLQAKMEKQQRMMLQQLQQSSGSVLLTAQSFVSPNINEKDTGYIFKQLIDEGYINDRGVVLDQKMINKETVRQSLDAVSSIFKHLNGRYRNGMQNEMTDAVTSLSDTQKQNILAEEQKLAVAKDVVSVLLNYQDQQDNLVLNTLSSFYQLPVGTTKAGMVLTEKQLAPTNPTPSDVYNTRLLLIYLEKGSSEYQNLNQHLQLLPRNLAWLEWNQLSPEEGLLIAKNPAPLGIPNMGPGYQASFSDLMAISAYKNQCKVFGVEGTEYLLGYLDLKGDANDMSSSEHKRNALAKIADWDSDQLDFLVDAFGSMIDFNTIQGVQTLINCFNVSQTMGIDVSLIWHLKSISDLRVTGDNDNANWNEYLDTASEFNNAFILHYGADEYETAIASIQGALEENTRDLLCSLLIWHLSESINGINSQDQLYEYLLLDVEMSSVVNISKLKLGLNSLQLYIQRCMMNLENGVNCTIPKAWWTWMSDYREWQANREVYLYPENYVDPNLRKLQSPLFKNLVSDVQQSVISKDSVTTAYTNYLNGLKDIANLEIVDSYAYEIPNANLPNDVSGMSSNKKMLTVFGRTKSDPTTYYYRQGLIPADGSTVTEENISWTPWAELNVNIPSDYITPVYAFNKLFVFWVTQTGGSSNYDSKSYPYIKATINFAYQQVGSGWSVPQVLKSDILICTMDENSKPILYTGPNNDSSDYYNDEQWQKVKAWAIPPIENKSAYILISLGDLVTGFEYDDDGSTTDNYTKEHVDFNQQLIKAADHSGSVSSGYTSIIPSFLLSPGLKEFEVVPSFDVSNTECYGGFIDSSTGNTQLIARAQNDFLDDSPANFSYICPIIDVDYYDLYTLQYLDGTSVHNSVNHDMDTIVQTINGQAEDVLSFNGTSSYMEIAANSEPILPQSFQFSCSFCFNDFETGLRTLFDTQTPDESGIALFIHKQDSNYSFQLNTYGESGSNYHAFTFPGITLNSEIWYNIELEVNSTEAKLVLSESNGSNSQSHQIDLSVYPYIPSQTELIIGGRNKHNDYYSGYIKDPVFKCMIHDGWTPYIGFPAGLQYLKAEGNDSVVTNTDIISSVETINDSREKVLSFNGVSAYFDINQPNNEILSSTFSFSCDLNFSTIYSRVCLFDCRDPHNYANGFSVYCDASEDHILLHLCTMGYDTNMVTIDSYMLQGDWYNLQLSVSENEVSVYLYDLKYNRVYEDNKVYQFPNNYTASTAGYFRVGADGTYNPDDAPTDHFQGMMRNPIFTNQSQSQFLLTDISGDTTSITTVKNQRSWFTLNTEQESFLAIPNYNIPLTSKSDVLEINYNSNGILELSYNNYIAQGNYIPNYQMVRLSTNVVEQMIENVLAGGLSNLLTPDNQYLFEPSFNQYQPANTYVPSSLMNFSGSYGCYFWELFYHIPMYIARSLQLEQQYPEAQQWFDVIFDPMLTPDQLTDVQALDDPDTTDDNVTDGTMRDYLIFRPFQTPDFQSIYDVLNNEPNQVLLYEYDPFDPNAIAALRPEAYAKATVMQYINNLIAYGDYLFTQDSWESINSATMYYTTAQRLLGKAPVDLDTSPKPMDKNYQDLEDIAGSSDATSPFLADLEVETPPSFNTGNSTLNTLLAQRYSLLNNYFCIPSNTQLDSYRQTISDRLYKIRNGLDINGQTNNIPLYQAPIDPNAAVQAAASGGAGSVSNLSANTNVPYYRFSYLIDKAKEFTGQVMQFGDTLLTALENKDAAHLSYLQETQSNVILNMMTQIKQSEIDQLTAQQEDLAASLESAKIQEETYQQWIDDGMNEHYKYQMNELEFAVALNTASALIHGIAAPLNLVPTIYGLADGGFEPAGVVTEAANSLDSLASLANYGADICGIKGDYDCANNDWTLQHQIALNTITSIQAQQNALLAQIDAAKQDLNINQTQISQSNVVLNFLQTKFTNEELYQWIAGQVSTVYFQAYQVAYNLASMAQTAFQYEYSTNQSFISNTGWNDLYKGLMAGQLLNQGLQQLEQAYIQGNSRSMEIEKSISLAELLNASSASGFDDFKANGTCNFSLTEQMFDLDFPGHYKRKIATVSMSIEGLEGTRSQVHATLTQTSNMVLSKPDMDAVNYALGLSNTMPDTVYPNWKNNQAIAISSTNNDYGMFRLIFNQDRYLFFEGTGAVSTWQLDMPRASNERMDDITDIIIHLKYTAYDGGSAFRNDVLDAETAQGRKLFRTQSGKKYISVSKIYGDDWQQFLATGNATISLERKQFKGNLSGLRFPKGATIVPVLKGTDVAIPPSIYKPSDLISANPFANGAAKIELKTDLSMLDECLLVDGKINSDVWTDLMVVVSYEGELDWGV